ncbi:MAG: haloacid dehalogenase type II [Thermaerobacter sp.]|nr:haloacid dehalogenase type II [Thermaerobacter sp.]
MKYIVFDAYGTLLNLSSLLPQCRAVIGDDAVRFLDLWRRKQLEYAFLRTLMDRYQPFSAVTEDALDYTLAAFGRTLAADQRRALAGAWRQTEPYPDAPPVLAALSAWTRVILSNGEPEMLTASVRHAGLQPHLTDLISVDAAGRYKPHPAAYRLIVDRYAVNPADVVFVSSNGWDVAGAAAFGFRTYWIQRTQQPVERLGVKPFGTLAALTDLLPDLAP